MIRQFFRRYSHIENTSHFFVRVENSRGNLLHSVLTRMILILQKEEITGREQQTFSCFFFSFRFVWSLVPKPHSVKCMVMFNRGISNI